MTKKPIKKLLDPVGRFKGGKKLIKNTNADVKKPIDATTHIPKFLHGILKTLFVSGCLYLNQTPAA